MDERDQIRSPSSEQIRALWAPTVVCEAVDTHQTWQQERGPAAAPRDQQASRSSLMIWTQTCWDPDRSVESDVRKGFLRVGKEGRVGGSDLRSSDWTHIRLWGWVSDQVDLWVSWKRGVLLLLLLFLSSWVMMRSRLLHAELQVNHSNLYLSQNHTCDV